MSADDFDDDEKAEQQLQRAELERLQAQADTRAVLSTGAGRRFVWRLLDGFCRLHASSFTGESLTSAHAEGRRSVGVELMVALQQADREGYLTMMVEQFEAARLKPPA